MYYELGYAHGVGNEAQDILLLAKEETILHFDIAPLRVQFYRLTEHLKSVVNTSIREMIGLRDNNQLTKNSSRLRKSLGFLTRRLNFKRYAKGKQQWALGQKS